MDKVEWDESHDPVHLRLALEAVEDKNRVLTSEVEFLLGRVLKIKQEKEFFEEQALNRGEKVRLEALSSSLQRDLLKMNEKYEDLQAVVREQRKALIDSRDHDGIGF